MSVSEMGMKRPERLLGAAILLAVFVLDAVVFGEVRVVLIALAGVLFVVLVAGAFDPMAESSSFQISMFVVQIGLTGYLLSRGLYVLAGIVSLSMIDSLWIVGSDLWTPGRKAE